MYSDELELYIYIFITDESRYVYQNFGVVN